MVMATFDAPIFTSWYDIMSYQEETQVESPGDADCILTRLKYNVGLFKRSRCYRRIVGHVAPEAAIF